MSLIASAMLNCGVGQKGRGRDLLLDLVAERHQADLCVLAGAVLVGHLVDQSAHPLLDLLERFALHRARDVDDERDDRRLLHRAPRADDLLEDVGSSVAWVDGRRSAGRRPGPTLELLLVDRQAGAGRRAEPGAHERPLLLVLAQEVDPLVGGVGSSSLTQSASTMPAGFEFRTEPSFG